MALNSLLCADVPLSNYSLTHSRYSGSLKHLLSNIALLDVLWTAKNISRYIIVTFYRMHYTFF